MNEEILEKIYHEVRAIRRIHSWQLWSKIVMWAIAVGIFSWGIWQTYVIIEPVINSDFFSNISKLGKLSDKLPF